MGCRRVPAVTAPGLSPRAGDQRVPASTGDSGTRCSVRRSAVAYIPGHELTRAAAEARFASPSHFSDTFRAMFGLTPTAFVRIGGELSVIERRRPPPLSAGR
ncbi:helix-turn-helix domain-containing protein [Nocardia sp. NPDC050799]|uniref:helix-turn-helix domain-containing protein n=1 Tax=Nocardia sp. NPDC050799 TaxID=3154842 RepID=UPI0033DE4A84